MSKEKTKKRWLFFGRDKYTYDTIEELVKKGVGLKIGEVVTLNGYYTAGDGANHKRVIANEDDGSGVQLANGLWANIVHNGEANVSWFGIDGNDDTLAVQKCLDYSKGLRVFIDKEVNVDKIFIKDNTFVYGINIIAQQIKIGYRVNLRDIKVTAKQITEDIPFILIKANEMQSAKSGIRVNNVFFSSQGNQINRDMFELDVDSCGFWDLILDNLTSDRLSFRTLFKIKSHKSKNELDKYPWCTNVVLSDSKFWGGVNCIEMLTYYTEDGEYGYISNPNDSKRCVLSLIVRDVHFEAIKGTVTFARIGNCVIESKFIKSFIGDFLNYDVSDTRTYYIIDDRNRKDGLRYFSFFFPNQKYKEYYKTVSGLDLELWNSDNSVVLYGEPNYGTNLAIEHTPKKISINPGIAGHPQLCLAIVPKRIPERETLMYLTSNTQSGYLHQKSVPFVHLIFNINDSSYKSKILAVTNIKELNELRVYEKEDEYLVTIDYTDNYFGFNTGCIMAFDGIKYVPSYPYRSDEDITRLGYVFLETVKIKNTNTINELGTTYMGEKMKQEGVYNDYITYMDEKTLYDKQQEKLEKEKKLAYEQALKENPNLTYEEFMAVQPMTLNLVEEPQPSEALQEFMEKYL